MSGLEIERPDSAEEIRREPGAAADSEKPLVSVVIPTFNRARFCEAAVRSALAQTYRPIEIIVVDDGSTDETPRIFTPAEPPLRYVRQEHQERAAARNRGVAEAGGAYVAFLDSDDFWSKRHVENSVEMLRAHPEAALAFGRAVYTTERGIPVREAPSPCRQAGLLSSAQAVAAMSREFIPFPLSSVVARREILLQLPFNEERALSRSEDWELWMRIAARYPVVATGRPSTLIRMHEGNTSQDAELTAQAMGRALELALSDPMVSQALQPLEGSVRSAMALELARLYAICGSKRQARAALESLQTSDSEGVDHRTLRRLRIMIWVPTPVVGLVRRLRRIADIALGYPAHRALLRELREVDVSLRPAC